VYPSVVFFQDTYHLNIERIYIAGLPESGGAAPALRAQTGAEVQELVASSQLGANASGPVPRVENGRSGGSVDFVRQRLKARFAIRKVRVCLKAYPDTNREIRIEKCV